MILKAPLIYEVEVEGRIERLLVTKKRIKQLYFRYDAKSRMFKVSAPILTSKDFIIKTFLGKYQQIRKLKKEILYEKDGYTYYRGNLVSFKKLNDMLNPKKEITNLTSLYSNEKKSFKEYIEGRVRYFEHLMNIKVPYNVNVRLYKSIWGSHRLNTKTISFNIRLIHYSDEVIDSIVIHELAHHFEANHQKKFYYIVKKYCPNYKKHHQSLKGGLFK